MRRFFRFGKPAYQDKQVAPVPEGQSSQQNGTYVNEAQRQILVKIVDGGNPEDLAVALGTLEIARDIVKQTIALWHTKDRSRKGILVPGNGNGGLEIK